MRGSLTGVRRELLDRVLKLFAMALDEQCTEQSGLAPAALAVVLADVFFPPLPDKLHAAGDALGAAAASGLSAAADDVNAIALRRIGFIRDLLAEGAL